MAEASIARCTQVNTESRAVSSAATPQQHWSADAHNTKHGWGRAFSVGTLLLMLYSPAVIPEGMGTIGAKRCRHQLPWPCAALTMLAPIFQLLLLLASASQPVCLQRKSLSPKQNVLPMSWFFSSPAWSLLQKQPKLPERKSRVLQASNKLAFIIPAKPPSARAVSKCRLCWPLGDCYKPKNIKTSKLMVYYSPSSQAPQEPCSGDNTADNPLLVSLALLGAVNKTLASTLPLPSHLYGSSTSRKVYKQG